MDFIYALFDGTVAGVMDITIILVYLAIFIAVCFKLFTMFRADRKYETAVLPDFAGETEALPDLPETKEKALHVALIEPDDETDTIIESEQDIATSHMLAELKEAQKYEL